MPEYPDNIITRLRALELQMAQMHSQATHSEAYGQMVAGPMVVGNNPPARRIVLNPDSAAAGDAEISLEPAGASNPVRILADTDGAYLGEAIAHIISSQGSAGDTELMMASGEVFMRVRDTGGGNAGGYARWGRDAARFGYVADNSGDNYFNFSASSLSRHVGRWDDFGSQPSNSGILWGTLTTPSGNSNTISYPATMDSAMGPVIGFRPANASPLISWQITASGFSSFSYAWSGSAQSAGTYMISFRV